MQAHERSPYLDCAQVHHESDFKYERYCTLVGNVTPAAADDISSDDAIKVAHKNQIGMVLFGLGRAGMIHLSNLLANPRVSLLYVVEMERARYDSVRARWGDRTPALVLPQDSATALADPRVDAVVVATPTFTHFEVIQQALDAGKMVFSEKPIAENAEQSRLCYETAAKLGLTVFCAFNRRFDPAFQAIQQAARRGDVGKVHTIKTVARDSPLPPIAYLKISGGIFHDCAVHDIDLICWVLGEFPRRALASASAHIAEIAAIGDHDTVAIVLEFDSGTIGTIDISRNAVYGYDQRLEVFGPKGLLTAENERPVNVRHQTSSGDTAVPFYFSFPSRYSEGYVLELEAFLDHVQGKIPLPILPEDSLRVSKIASACEESLRTGAFVTIDYAQ
ncbi:inositol 2-dehydrogenase-like [Pollicipes pollicipes]|uniref:inositol 2-dehydrogenase-like n=1 Tax=Pollicipes pollicipes TaxID=41117 RepID=UPI0018850FB4|nr:inositol 2-dehydrogenase-like [Pollicipes pollicipes]XP_037089869.1 inositol 2-dehydrogenase-like [Pollicipes pollicipes]